MDTLIVLRMLYPADDFNVYGLTNFALTRQCFCKQCIQKARKETTYLEYDEYKTEPLPVVEGLVVEVEMSVGHNSVRKYPG